MERSGELLVVHTLGPGCDAPAEVREHAEAMLRHWPVGPRPELRLMAVPQLLTLLTRDDQVRRGSTRVCLLHGGGEHAIDDLDRCVDELRTAGIPTIVVTSDVPRLAPLENVGVMVRAQGESPLLLAACAHTLLHRQRFVDTLLREYAILNRCQAGVRAEVERIHEELHLAAGVQHEFTSASLPDLPDLDLSVLYRPVNSVSGDIYNVREHEDGTIAFFVADAVGHGVPAALLTMVLTNSLIIADHLRVDGRGRPHHLSPGEVLQRLNARLVESSLHTGRFATGLYGTLNPTTGALTVAGAGHPAPAIASRDGGVRQLETNGPLLGVFPDAEFDEATTILRPDQTLLLYTDGLEAAFPRATLTPHSGEPLPTHLRELHELLHADDQPEEGRDFIAQLEVLLDEQSGSLHQADDITLVAMRLRALANDQRASSRLAA